MFSLMLSLPLLSSVAMQKWDKRGKMQSFLSPECVAEICASCSVRVHNPLREEPLVGRLGIAALGNATIFA